MHLHCVINKLPNNFHIILQSNCNIYIYYMYIVQLNKSTIYIFLMFYVLSEFFQNKSDDYLYLIKNFER